MEPTSQYGTFPPVVEMNDKPNDSTVDRRINTLSQDHLITGGDYSYLNFSAAVDLTTGGISSAALIGFLFYNIYDIAVNPARPNSMYITMAVAAIALAPCMMFLGRGIGTQSALGHTSKLNIPT